MTSWKWSAVSAWSTRVAMCGVAIGWRVSMSSPVARRRSRKPRNDSLLTSIRSFVSIRQIQFLFRRGRLHALPALDAVVLHAEEIEHAPDCMIDEVVHGLRVT